MANKDSTDLKLEIGHVLFMDIVGYSKLLIHEQSERQRQLNEIVRKTEQFRAAKKSGKLIRLSRGDGMALVFFNTVEAPVQCALEINKALLDHPELKLRMGVHSGPINRVRDVDDRPDVAGVGINMAQRVMDCGDAGHILLSKRVADDLAQYPRWRPYLRELGECGVKHGVRLFVVNLFTDELGNPQQPKKFIEEQKAKTASMKRAGPSFAGIVAVLSLIALAIVAIVFVPAILRSREKAQRRNLAPATEASSALIPEKSIAVLPFANLSDDKANAYFADGIQDEILTRLSKIADLKVISRTSTQHYKSPPENLPAIARQLGVAHILEGSVQKSGDAVRVNVQLIKAANDSHLWADSFDRKLTDIFSVESEVSQKIANSLQARLSPAEAKNLTSTPTQDSEAYDFFLKGEYAEYEAEVLLKAESFDRAAAAYEQALARDPNFALAAARLVISRSRRHFFISQLSEAELNELKKLADRTVTLAPSLPEAHIALATFYYLGKRQYGDALTELQRTLELQPNNVGALILSGYVHRRQGQWKRGLSEMLKAEARDPRNPQLVGNIAGAYCSLRMWDDARRFGLRALAIDPHSILGLQSAIFSSLNGKGDIVEAKRTMENYPPVGRLAEFTVLGSMPMAAYLKVIERDFTGALKLCESEIVDPAENRSRLAVRAAIHILAGDTATAQNEIGRARELLEFRLRERPDDFVALLQLSWVNVALKRNAEALRLAQRATEVLPPEKDALLGPTYLACLAEIQARTGESREAVKMLRRLLSMPIGFYISIQQLKIDPVWDPIRPNPGFQQLLVSKEKIGP